MTPHERERFGHSVSAYIGASDQQDLEALLAALAEALRPRLGAFAPLADAGVAGIVDAIARAHGAPAHGRSLTP